MKKRYIISHDRKPDIFIIYFINLIKKDTHLNNWSESKNINLINKKSPYMQQIKYLRREEEEENRREGAGGLELETVKTEEINGKEKQRK